MSTINLTITDFTFPVDLEDAYATFRLGVSLTYTDSENKTAHMKEVLPGVGNTDYWECETSHKKKADYLRRSDAPKIDLDKAPAESLIARLENLSYSSLDSLSVTIYDVEKDGKLDKFWREAAKVALGVGLDLLPVGTAITVGNVLKSMKNKQADRSDVEKTFDDAIDSMKKAGKTRILWQKIADLSPVKSGDHITVTGNSPKGVFTVEFSLKIK